MSATNERWVSVWNENLISTLGENGTNGIAGFHDTIAGRTANANRENFSHKIFHGDDYIMAVL